MTRSPFVLGTRGSALAIAQARFVRDALVARNPGVHLTELVISTTGDERRDVPLAAIGGQGVFVAEIERALADGRVDIAVHSAKDLPSAIAPGLRLAAFLERADPRDVLLSRAGVLAELPRGARVGTSSPRRACQLRAARPDLTLLDLRGNVDTRIARLDRGDYDAIVLAAAGIVRIGMAHRVTEWFGADVMLPMVAQGAIAIETRGEDDEAIALAAALDHSDTSVAVSAERAFLARLGAGCSAPLAAHATVSGDQVMISGMIGAADGRQVRGTAAGPRLSAVSLGTELAEQLITGGGEQLMSEMQRA